MISHPRRTLSLTSITAFAIASVLFDGLRTKSARLKNLVSIDAKLDIYMLHGIAKCAAESKKRKDDAKLRGSESLYFHSYRTTRGVKTIFHVYRETLFERLLL